MGVFITLAIIVAVVVVVIIAFSKKDNSEKLGQLKLAYEQSLKGSNKSLALTAGRTYYSALREGKTLTMYDELAIGNDLCTMSDHARSGQIL